MFIYLHVWWSFSYVFDDDKLKKDVHGGQTDANKQGFDRSSFNYWPNEVLKVR